jgi:hypothetical protein
MKNYCKKVAQTGEMISIEAELPLFNAELKRQLKLDALGGGEDIDLDGDDDEEEEDDDGGGGYAEGAMNAGGDEGPTIPPAGRMKVLVHVYAQVEASTQDMKVGLGRNEPNRLPSVTYPKTGRSWQSVLPTALAAVEAIIEAYQGGTKRCKFLMCIVLVLVIIVGLHYPGTGQGGCALIQGTCKNDCKCCQDCHDENTEASTFCYAKYIPSYPDSCASSGDKKTSCRCATDSCDDITTASTFGWKCNYALVGATER